MPMIRVRDIKPGDVAVFCGHYHETVLRTEPGDDGYTHLWTEESGDDYYLLRPHDSLPVVL
jgi:hypothetical protein